MMNIHSEVFGNHMQIESMCCNPGQNFQEVLNSAAPGIVQHIPLCKVKVTETKKANYSKSVKPKDQDDKNKGHTFF